LTQRPTIALDATYAAHPQPTGIGIYSQQLISAFGELARSAISESPQMVLGFRPGPYVREARKLQWPEGFRLAPLFDKWITWPRANLFHGLNQRLPETHYARTVVTLHERFPSPSDEYSTPEFRSHMCDRIENALARADRIIVVSHSVREHLSLHRPTLSKKTRVVHHGVARAAPIERHTAEIFLQERVGLQSSQPFFLTVGAVQVRKNLKNLAHALQPLAEAHLVIAGNDGYGADEIRQFIQQQGLAGRVHFTGHLRSDELRLLYSSAVALAFPSLEEAFGMPILEAMSCGCPVITSNVSAMPEVAGDAAILVDPQNVAQLGEAMRTVFRNPNVAAALRAKGLQRAAEFSWEKCAKETWAVYQELL
jgi:glycosyltransferase involved in cell wall biosynthesis